MVGRTLLHYEILEKLGEGGMGVVYKARDTHLNRFVAIKVLPPEKIADAERKRRFALEARSASALNHPNIVTIYDIASENDIDFISMEYVPGKTLTQLITRKGLPLDGVLRCAVQIADALATAHAAGIVHRDLKPGNVMVTGTLDRALIKVLDFGLAKLIDSVDKGEQKTTAQDEAPSTAGGTILGTDSYMSPEQAEGKQVDGRSDIFSFGSLLYEMVTGQRAFYGGSRLATLSAILREEPRPACEIVAGLPRELERIIARCLRKDPGRRFQAMPDLKVALEELREESDSGAYSAAPAVRRRRRRPPIWGAVLLVIICAGFGARWFLQSSAKPPETELSATPLTTYPGFEDSPSFSPDGNQVVFSWNGHIYIKLIGTAAPPLRLTADSANDFSPTWSPDGRFVAFLRGLENGRAFVLLVPALGGPERKLGDVPRPGTLTNLLPGPYLAWSPDGTSLVVCDRDPAQNGPFALFLWSIETGEKRRLTSPPGGLAGDSGPAFSPDGDSVAFSRSVDVGVSDLYVLAVSKGMKPLGKLGQLTFENRNATSPTWTPDGREIVFGNPFFGGSLWRVAVPSPTGEPGEPRRLGALGENNTNPAMSRVGRRLAFVHLLNHTDIWRVAAPGNRMSRDPNYPIPVANAGLLVASTRNDHSPQYSPDGKNLAFVSTRSGHPEIWACGDDGSNAVQLTTFKGPDVSTPRWSPDGARIAFDSNAGGGFDVWTVEAGGGRQQRLTKDPANDGNPSWSHDGRWIYFDSGRTGQQEVWKMSPDGGGTVQVTRDGGWAPLEAPDGKYLFYTKALGNTSLWKMPVNGGEASKVLDGLSHYMNFAIVDGGVYFIPTQAGRTGSSIQFLSFATNKIMRIAAFEKPLTRGLTVSPAGKWILYSQVEQSGSELMLVENFH